MRIRALLFTFAALLTVSYCVGQPAPPLPGAAKKAALDSSKVIDLTWDLGPETIYWPTGQPFQWKEETWGSSRGFWYASGRFSASEHGGTHLDSPIHFAEHGLTMDQIPLNRLVAPAEVVDISKQAAGNRDYLLSRADITQWEKQHGPLPQGSIVLIRTGWGKFWPNKKQYLGDDTPGKTNNLHFPGISSDAAKLLAERRVAGVGIDTASIDNGPSQDFMTHRILMGAGIYGLENVAHLDRVPTVGATLIALPMKIKGGSGGPVRIIAALP